MNEEQIRALSDALINIGIKPDTPHHRALMELLPTRQKLYKDDDGFKIFKGDGSATLATTAIEYINDFKKTYSNTENKENITKTSLAFQGQALLYAALNNQP